MAEIPKFSMTIARPLSSVGMENLVICMPDGRLTRFKGVAVERGETILGAIWRTIPAGATVYADMECFRRDEYAVLH